MYKVLSFAAAIALLAGGPAMAQQQQQCNKRDNVLKLLADKYQEAPVAVGVTNNGGLVEVLTTGSGKTWTIIVTSPKGVSCLVAAGEGWRAKEQMAFDPEA